MHRIWKQEGLSLPRKRPGKRSYGPKGEVKQRATHLDHVWTYDICEDRTERGGRLRLLSVVDEYTRECLAIEVAPSIGGEQVVETLEQALAVDDRPVVVDFAVSKEENVFPFIPAGKSYEDIMHCPLRETQ